MAYSINPVEGNFQNNTIASSFPSTFRYVLMSCWVELKPDHSGWQMAAVSNSGTAYSGFFASLDWAGQPGAVLQVQVGNGTSYGFNLAFGNAAFDTTSLVAGVYYNILISIDSVANIIQVYVNDVALPSAGDAWFDTTPIAAPVSGSSPLFVTAQSTFLDSFPCMADAFWSTPAAFFDLSITANRRKFINSDLTPVFLGDNGELPLGTEPIVYLTVPPANPATAFETNRGFAGDSFTTAPFGAPSLCLTPPTTTEATVADLWFGSTADFVDLTVEANRRNFISATGGARRLGATGQLPFGVTPPLFLSREVAPSTFAMNAGRGGSFSLSEGALTAGATDPPGSRTSLSLLVPGSPGKGVLGDYRNGNIYAFNPKTLTDNGTSRRWLRRWRALPGSRVTAVKFSWLSIDMETGAGVPPGTTAQVVLRWSDDGGHTFGPERIISVGPLGATKFTVKANRLGSTRRFSGSDRIYEISSTDAFIVSILDANLEAS